MLYLGIDQHRKQLTVSLRDEAGMVVLRRQVSTQWEAVRTFFAALREQAAPAGGYAAVVEICGFNEWLLALLAEYGCRRTVLVQATGRALQKTDRRDAGRLSELLWLNRGRLGAGEFIPGLRQVEPPTSQDAAARQLTALRQRLGRQRTRTLNRIQHLLLKHNLQQASPTKALQTQKCRRWLENLPLPPADRLELTLLLEQWKQDESRLKSLEPELRKQQAAHPLAPLVATIPGLSAYASLAIACRVGSWKRFPRPESLVNFFGLAPSCNNSGDKTRRLAGVTKQGSPQVRALLSLAVLHVLKRDAKLRTWYQRVKKRRGAKIARVAVMRRMAAILWRMLRTNEPYQIGGRRAAILPAAN